MKYLRFDMKKIVVLLVLVLASCEYSDREYPLVIVNNSNKKLGVYLGYSGYTEYYYSDTTICKTKPYTLDLFNQANEWIDHSRIEWKEHLTQLPKDTMSIFILDMDTVNANPWQKIRENYKILKRYDLSIKDLEILDYRIPYPENTKMQNMKMYPKYGH